MSKQNPNSPGRPRALDEIKRREICALVSAGCGMEDAARYVGCAASTIRREARRDKDFNEALRRAMLAAELSPLNALRQAATKHWRAAAWMLERTNPLRYSRLQLRPLKPELFHVFTRKMLEILMSEVHDRETLDRVFRGVADLSRRAEREAWAIERDRFISVKVKPNPDQPGFLDERMPDPFSDIGPQKPIKQQPRAPYGTGDAR